jgi:hypothetical protein
MTTEKTKIDVIDLDKQLKYKNLGITYVSNNLDIVSRDQAGNILVSNSSSKLLTIEPIAENILLDSMLRVIDTQFTYYSFPVSIKSDTGSIDLDFDLPAQDIVFARYRPSENREILAGSSYSGILMDDVQDGLTQQYSNQYTISKDIKNSDIDLRFRIKIQHRYDTPNAGYGTAYFSIIKTSDQGIEREYRTFENTSDNFPNVVGSINQYEVQNAEYEIVIPNSEFEIGDRFGIGAKAGQNDDNNYHTINFAGSYWVISDASKNVDLWNQELLTTGSIND